MARAGDIVVIDFPGAHGVKRRPTVVVSSNQYHRTRPDVIVGVVTSQIESATQPSDYVLQDWKSAGLRKPSAFRSFFVTLPKKSILATIGQVSPRDQKSIIGCIHSAMMT